MTTKLCRICLEHKTLDAFAKQKAGKHGVRATCKECRRAARSSSKSAAPVSACKPVREKPNMARVKCFAAIYRTKSEDDEQDIRRVTMDCSQLAARDRSWALAQLERRTGIPLDVIEAWADEFAVEETNNGRLMSP